MMLFRLSACAATCCLLVGHAVARPCGAQRATPRTAVFAVPVAQVVVFAQPTILYSYRASLSSATATTPTSAPAVGEALTIEALLRQRCASCHQGETPKGGLRFFTADGTLAAKLPRRAILEATSPDEHGVTKMPPGEAAKLNAEEIELLRPWAEPPRELWY